MNCPSCNSNETKVIDSRLSGEGFSIRRRRSCQSCSFRFSTIEEIEILDLVVIKRDGHRENYTRDKLIRGLRTSLEKRAYLEEDFRRMISEIERDIQKKATTEITSQQMGEIIMKRLKAFDQVAYIRYASVYRSFKDAKTFQKELNRLLKKKNKK
ncbi:transcriptional repressor NrdR [Candidatus Parcubacteria bacterium]|jgi:transcriptional repressor NrdR|nr:transcriptional repressor NrdR [Candidatus Parcubacteria bacterium]